MEQADWRAWLLVVFTDNTDRDRAMTDDQLKAHICLELDYLALTEETDHVSHRPDRSPQP